MSSEEPRSRIDFRVKPEERKRILADAKIAGLTVGSYIRSKLIDTPQTQAMFRENETRRLMKDLIGQIGRVGNNMNQIAFKLNSDLVLDRLDKTLHAEGVEALKQMRAVLVNHLLTPKGPC